MTELKTISKIEWFQSLELVDLEQLTKIDSPRWCRYLSGAKEPTLGTVNRAAKGLNMVPGELVDAINLRRRSVYRSEEKYTVSSFQSLSSSDLEKLTSVPAPRWCRYLRGQNYQDPRLDTINQAAKELGMTPGELTDAINLRRTQALVKDAKYLGINISCTFKQVVSA